MKYTDAFNVPMSPHKLRHSYGTKLALKTNGNIPIIMTQMGHSTVIHQCYTLMNQKRLLSKILINLMISIELYLLLR